MHPGRCSALLNDMLNGICIFFRVQLFVFFFESSRMSSFVADAAFVRCLLLFRVLIPVLILFFHIY